ncbi:hypothetical protein LXL04_000950 [Taraxacum kok-saghyz]
MELLLLRKKTEEAWAGHKEAVSIPFLLPLISLFWISFAPIIAKSKIIEKIFLIKILGVSEMGCVEKVQKTPFVTRETMDMVDSLWEEKCLWAVEGDRGKSRPGRNLS